MKHFAVMEKLVEKAARLTLAKYAADKRIKPDKAIILGGRPVATYTADKSHVKYVRFNEWATARGVKFKYDSEKCVITLTRDRTDYVVPIGAKAIGVRRAWRQLPDIVMISADREERTLVPLAIDSLTTR